MAGLLAGILKQRVNFITNCSHSSGLRVYDLISVRKVLINFLFFSKLVAEGRVANFLLATTAIASTRSSLVYGKYKKHVRIVIL